jgi:hypothetical protein
MGDIQTNAPEWAEFYNPVAGGTHFGILDGDYTYKHKHESTVYSCSSSSYRFWNTQPGTVPVIKIQENE